MLQKNCSCSSNVLNPAISFLNNGPLLNITEQKDPERPHCFPSDVGYSFPFCFAFAIRPFPIALVKS